MKWDTCSDLIVIVEIIGPNVPAPSSDSLCLKCFLLPLCLDSSYWSFRRIQLNVTSCRKPSLVGHLFLSHSLSVESWFSFQWLLSMYMSFYLGLASLINL